MCVDRPSTRACPRSSREGGFSFLEVLLAMSILLLGAVAILSLFALGVNHLVHRQIDAKLEQVRTEVSGIVQAAVDQKAPGDLPESIPTKSEEPPRPLSLPGFGVRVEFGRAPFGAGVLARAFVFYQGRIAKVLPPIPVIRSTIDPR